MERVRQLLFDDKPDWFGPKVLAYFQDNPTFFLTVAYIGISALGLVYELALFARFDINVLDYSEAADFFLAAFKRPEALFASLGIVLTLAFYRGLANFLRRRESAWWYLAYPFAWIGFFRREILVPLGLVYFFFFYFSIADSEGGRIVTHYDTTATVTVRFGTPAEFEFIPVGATERFFFGVEYGPELRDFRAAPKDQRRITPKVRGIPFSNITKIEYNSVAF